MFEIPPAVRELAEDTPAYGPLRDGDRRIVTPGYIVHLGHTPGPHSTVVARLRLGPGEVQEAIAAVRALLRAEGRSVASWEVGTSATPQTLGDELLAAGMKPAAPPFTLTTAMVLPGIPPRSGPRPQGVEITQVRTLADFRRAQEIYWSCFDFRPDAAAQSQLEPNFRHLSESQIWHCFLAWQGGQPVAAADAVLTDVGVILFGGATLPTARGHGIYQALVRERWELAARRGTPYLITQAGALSRPVLAHLGFVATAEIQNFLDQGF